MRALKISGIVVVVLVALIAIFIAVFDWNMLRGYIGDKITTRTGREFSISGDLDVDLSLTPRIHAERVRFANASWGTEPLMLDLELVEFRLSLLSLLKGSLHFPEIALTNAKVVLERDRDGNGNWVIGAKKEEGRPPIIDRLSISEGSRLIVRDPVQRLDLAATFSSDSAAANPKQQLRFDAKGEWKGMKVSAKGSGGSLFDLRDQNSPYPLKANVSVGSTSASLDGTVTGLAEFASADLAFTLAGQDLGALYEIIKLALPSTPPYRIKGHLTHQGKRWKFSDFSGNMGDSDIRGEFAVDTAGKRPKIHAELSSKLLDFDDLGPIIGAPPKTGRTETASLQQKREAARLERKGKAFPDREFSLERLRAADADIKFKTKRIQRSAALPIEDLALHLILDDAVLTLKPLNFGVAGGDIVSTIVLDGRSTPIKTRMDVRFSKLKLDRLFPTVNLTKSGIATIGGHAGLKATGNSVAKMMASADGEFALAAAGGRISNLLLEIVGLDGAEIIRFLLGGDRQAVMRCAVADFKVENGVMHTRTLVLDTSDTNVQGSGTVNLKNEQIDLTLKPLPKDKSFLSLRAPIHVTGTIRDPSVAPDASKMVARGGAALLLGALNPLLALIPLIETGPGTDADCNALVAAAKHKDNPGKGRSS